jgi:hypothetical protein
MKSLGKGRVNQMLDSHHLQNQAMIFGDRSTSQFSKLFFGPQKIFHTQTFLCVETDLGIS